MTMYVLTLLSALVIGVWITRSPQTRQVIPGTRTIAASAETVVHG